MKKPRRRPIQTWTGKFIYFSGLLYAAILVWSAVRSTPSVSPSGSRIPSPSVIDSACGRAFPPPDCCLPQILPGSSLSLRRPVTPRSTGCRTNGGDGGGLDCSDDLRPNVAPPQCGRRGPHRPCPFRRLARTFSRYQRSSHALAVNPARPAWTLKLNGSPEVAPMSAATTPLRTEQASPRSPHAARARRCFLARRVTVPWADSSGLRLEGAGRSRRS